MNIYRRYLRHSTYDRVRHSENLLDFLIDQSIRLSGTGTGQGVTFDNTTNTVTLAAHGFTTGQGPFVLGNAGGALPAELDSATDYWVNVTDANTFTLHLTEADALAGTNAVAFTDNGTGTHSIYVGADPLDIFEAMKSGKTAEQIASLQTIDEL